MFVMCLQISASGSHSTLDPSAPACMHFFSHVLHFTVPPRCSYESLILYASMQIFPPQQKQLNGTLSTRTIDCV